MAIGTAVVKMVSRGKGDNACRKGAYNARTKVIDHKNGKVFDFTKKGGNLYHKILLPEHVDSKFKDVTVLMNEVERAEPNHNSQLLKEIMLALPDDKEITIEDCIEITLLMVKESKWVENGLGVQIDIHEPDKENKNRHAHLLITTRRFDNEGKGLCKTKARDLNPNFVTVNGKRHIVPEEIGVNHTYTRVLNRYFRMRDLDLRVDPTAVIPQEHVGAVRMRSIVNEAVERNNIRRIANLEIIRDPAGVLGRITRTQAIFSKGDIRRAVKEIKDENEKNEIIAKVMKSEQLLPLYYSDGKVTGMYTTKDIREQEERVLRLTEKINQQLNNGNIAALSKDIRDLQNVSEAQRGALQDLLLKNGCGVRILIGRAGTGKSHVLGKVNEIATLRGQNVIGLAPTNKARAELKTKGYSQCYTIKGFLFYLHNNKITLPTNSLLVVDEAGMVSTAEYAELMKFASSKQSNLILTGDDRQSNSVEYGGMFEILKDKFGAYELNEIRRQSQQWGKDMALCFAEGKVEKGMAILKTNGALKEGETLKDSISQLVEDWQNSKFSLKDRLIITVRNQDVDALNYAVREMLKAKGILQGKEYSITKKISSNNEKAIAADKDLAQDLTVTVEQYMAGERIVFVAADKELGVENGDFGTITYVSDNKFTVDTDKGIKVSFDPSKMSSFKHGYASTVYKVQGISIKAIYILHNIAGNLKSSYVQMTRFIEEIKFYYNQETTGNYKNLLWQLSRPDEKGASLKLCTKANLEQIQRQQEKQTIFNKLGWWVKDTAVAITDSLHTNEEYYRFEAPPKVEAMVKEVTVANSRLVANKVMSVLPTKENKPVILPVAENDNDKFINKGQEAGKIKLAAGEVMNNKQLSNNFTKEAGTTLKAEQWNKLKLANQEELQELKRRISPETIAIDLLGEPNSTLSNKNSLRWGEKGGVVLTISGSKAGLWYNFETGEGGDIFKLVQKEKGYGFTEAVNYVRSKADISTNQSPNPQNLKGEEVTAFKKSDKVVAERFAYEIVPEYAPKFNPKKQLSFFFKDKKLVRTYTYKNEAGKLIGYTIRVVYKETDEKAVLPVTYCHNNKVGAELKEGWYLQGLPNKSYEPIKSYKPIYGLEKLSKDRKPILIVEGEKTTDAAQKLLKDYTVISWLGGSTAAGSADWSKLTGREVVIWGDNDQPGLQAAKTIEQKLAGIASSCFVVDPKVLELPSKWDLADRLPKGLSDIHITALLVSSKQPETVKIIDQQIQALDHLGNSNEQLIKLLEREVLTSLKALGKDNNTYHDRLKEELAVIAETKFAEDFVIAANIARYCQQMNITIGYGRGSAVSSLVAYGLGIHKIDPIEHDLLFERFLTAKTTKNPDFDFDIAASKRILVENYLCAKYHNAAKLSVIHQDGKTTFHPSGIGLIPASVQHKLAPEALTRITGKFWEDRQVLTIHHTEAEKLGVKKFDLLSSNVLESLQKLETLIASQGKVALGKEQANQLQGEKINWQQIGWSDKKTFELIKAGDTDGVYQLGKDFAKEACQKVKMDSFYDLVNLLALIRLGDKGNHNNQFTDPKEIFKSTQGVPLFQEQIMQAASTYLGINKDETNDFRRELTKEHSNHPLIIKTNFLQAARNNGLSNEEGNSLYQLLKQFSKFGFNKSHAVAYAHVTFKTAYLKAHYRELFNEIFTVGDNQLSKDHEQLQQQEPYLKKQQSELSPITGKQDSYLDSTTVNKAEVRVKKHSSGQISSSFVKLQTTSGQKPHPANITFIAEGVENALSIQEAKLFDRGTILCTQGVNNLKNYQPTLGEKIMICADNDGKNASSQKAVVRAVVELENKGAIVAVVMPKEQGNFNNMLQKYGADAIKKQLAPEINQLVQNVQYDRHIATIVANNQAESPEQTALFSLEAKALKRFAPKKMIEVINTCQIKGIKYAIQEAATLNHNAVNSKLLDTITAISENGGKSVKDFADNSCPSVSSLFKAVAADKEVLRYIDKSEEYISKAEQATGKAVVIDGFKASDFSNQMLIKEIADQHQDNPALHTRFIDETTALQRFAPSKLSKMIKEYEQNGVEAAANFAEAKVKEVINLHLQNSINYFYGGREDGSTQKSAFDFSGNKVSNETDYLLAIGRDQQAMSYLKGTEWETKINFAIKEETRFAESNQLRQLEGWKPDLSPDSPNKVKELIKDKDFGIGD